MKTSLLMAVQVWKLFLNKIMKNVMQKRHIVKHVQRKRQMEILERRQMNSKEAMEIIMLK